ncbi:MAG: ABC transporter permease [Candidatus Accumulibacter sp.]|uniref:ABC transporter permease n=1 Tax=Candidatus Accumulibacter affinis TaxID=2954384 RepID=A0A935T4X7_9PROT|nr:ABC transporter permease [Candidatus Accumulibacter affinis]MBP9805155.1 ABC transporter permease [Accumulibacter sp.]
MLQPYTSLPERVWYYAFRVLCGLILLFLIMPIIVIIPLSFNSDSFLMYPMSGFSLRWYEEFFGSEVWRTALKNSMIISPLATVVAVVLGTLASIGLVRANFPGKALLVSILIAPMVVPVVIVGVAVYLFFSPLGLTGSYTGLVLAHAVLGVPFVVITVTATLQGFDYNLVRAAASLGANPVTTFFKVTLPLVAPGVVSGALFAFATSFDEVVVTLFLASPEQSTLPRQMFSGIRDNISPTIAAVATVLIVLATLMLLVLERMRRNNERLRTAKPE